MSHHTTVKTEFKDLECIEKALDRQQLRYSHQLRDGKVEKITIKRHDIDGARYRDVTFTDKNGEIEVGLDSDDKQALQPFLEELKQDYAVEVIKKQAGKNNMYVSEQVKDDGTIQLRLTEY